MDAIRKNHLEKEILKHKQFLDNCEDFNVRARQRKIIEKLYIELDHNNKLHNGKR